MSVTCIVALRNEKGSYNVNDKLVILRPIVALRNEKGSYNVRQRHVCVMLIVALRNEKGSYNKQFSQDAWHEYCKRQFIGSEELPDGSQIGISTTTLNTGEMTDYQNRIQAWAAQEFGIIWEF